MDKIAAILTKRLVIISEKNFAKVFPKYPIIVIYYRNKGSIRVEDIHGMKG